MFGCSPGNIFVGCPCLRGAIDVLYTAEPVIERNKGGGTRHMLPLDY